MTENPNSANRRVVLVDSCEFSAIFVALANQSRHSILAAYYLVNVSPVGDEFRSQRQAIKALVRAKARGVDVRLLLGWPSREVSKRRNLLATQFFKRRKVPVRVATQIPFHSKFCVFDELHGLLGSHNLTVGSFVENVEISVAFRSSDMCRELAAMHHRLWNDSQSIALSPALEKP